MMEKAFAIKHQGHLLTETVSPSRLHLIDQYPDLLSGGGEIVTVLVEEIDEEGEDIKGSKFCPNTYVFQSGRGYLIGGISDGMVSNNPSVISARHPLIATLEGISHISADSLFLVEIERIDDSRSVVRSAAKLALFDNGDTTTAAKLFKSGSLQGAITRFFESEGAN